MFTGETEKYLQRAVEAAEYTSPSAQLPTPDSSSTVRYCLSSRDTSSLLSVARFQTFVLLCLSLEDFATDITTKD